MQGMTFRSCNLKKASCTRQEEEVMKGGQLRFRDGSLAVPDSPGLGDRLDRTAPQHLHQGLAGTWLRSA